MLQYSESRPIVSDSLRPHGLYNPWNSPGQNTGVGSLSLLQGIFPTQGLSPGLLHCRQILYQLSHKGSPRILEWVAYPFSSGSSRLRNQTGVSCIAGGSLPTELSGKPWYSLFCYTDLFIGSYKNMHTNHFNFGVGLVMCVFQLCDFSRLPWLFKVIFISVQILELACLFPWTITKILCLGFE